MRNLRFLYEYKNVRNLDLDRTTLNLADGFLTEIIMLSVMQLKMVSVTDCKWTFFYAAKDVLLCLELNMQLLLMVLPFTIFPTSNLSSWNIR